MFFCFSEAYFDNTTLFDEFIENVDYALPIIFYYDHHDLPVQKSITKKIKEFYFGNKLTRDKKFNVTNVCSSIAIFCIPFQSKQFSWKPFSYSVMDGFWPQWTHIYVWSVHLQSLQQPMYISWQVNQRPAIHLDTVVIQKEITVCVWIISN